MTKVCRLCIAESTELTDISEIREGLPISVVIMIICPVKIEPEDSLPKHVCEECLQTVLSAYKLRDVSNKIDRYFRSCHGETDEIEELKIISEHIEQEDTEAEIDAEPDYESSENEEVFEGNEDILDKDGYVVIHEYTEEDSGRMMVEIDPNFKYQVDCQNVQNKKSAVWKYIGYLTDENGKAVDDEKDYYFCKICVEQHQMLKPKYKIETIATSVLFAHLVKVHGLNKSDMSESVSVNPVHSVAELVPCEICEKSVNAGSMSIHMGIEHQNGAMSRVGEKSSQYKVNCFKTSSKSLAWDYFGALENPEGEQIDVYYFYCRLCVEEEEKLHPKYTKNTSTSILLQHLKNVHIPKTPEELAKRKLPEPITLMSSSKRLKRDDFSCKLCGEQLDSRKSLNRHLAKKHDEEQPRNYVCQFENCQKSFTMRDTLFKHVKNIHQGTKFPCDRCPAVLSSRMSLRRHIESCHLKLKQFACDSCNTTYTEQKSLKNHIQKVHMGISEKRVPCNLCELSFPSQWSLRRHSLTHTGEVNILFDPKRLKL